MKNPYNHLFRLLHWILGLASFGSATLVDEPGGFYGITIPMRILNAARIASPADELKSLPWSDARELDISLTNGCGFDNGHTIVRLQALHDGRELFIRATWDDQVEDRRYWPWKKKEREWERLMSNPDDEQVFYEDKFSLITRPSFLQTISPLSKVRS